MLLKNALKYSDKVRRREWEQDVVWQFREDGTFDQDGKIPDAIMISVNQSFDDWEPVPLPGDITILCRECGEEFYIEEQDCEGNHWTIRTQCRWRLGIECPNCNTCY